MFCNFPNKFPFTNFHETNLDWILQKVNAEQVKLVYERSGTDYPTEINIEAFTDPNPDFYIIEWRADSTNTFTLTDIFVNSNSPKRLNYVGISAQDPYMYWKNFEYSTDKHMFTFSSGNKKELGGAQGLEADYLCAPLRIYFVYLNKR